MASSPMSAAVMLLFCLVLSLAYSTEATASKNQMQAKTKRHLEVSSSVVHREAVTETGKKVAAHIRSASKKQLETNKKSSNMDAVEEKKASAKETRNALDGNMDALDEAYAKIRGERSGALRMARVVMRKIWGGRSGAKEHGSNHDAKDLGLLQSKVSSTPKIWGSWTDSFTSASEFVLTWPKHVWDYEFVYAFKTNVWRLPTSYWYSHLLSMLVYLAFGVLFAYLYQEAKNQYYPKFFTLEPRPEILPSSEGFTFGIFECFSDTNLCILGCCCPFLRWADTIDRQGFLSYWQGFLIMFSCILLHTFTYGISDVILIIVGIFYRQKLRSRLQIESATPKSLCTDCLVWTCCQPCAIIQEAHEEVVQHAWGTLQEEV